ncbi:cold shock protein (beta-ribbon, CspA family) [Roseospirillum parvum]|uniref:Cold shock protein (Beta-ribbon, CspA family) n=1 Tax=Roseospirillum parvum TaxID=83401 RepID=A0A1G8CT47_9PROT|nr:cold-shock protein [Roseospirillum parvum]SDH48621.1 cold shock protein (beta-ribbon, CspA family) [Roseospirillum parvum]
MSDFDRGPAGAGAGVSAQVKWFNGTKGFGFVAPSDGSADAFLHISVLERAGVRDVAPGTTLVCRVEPGPRGPQVSAIVDIDESTATAPAGGPPGGGAYRPDGGDLETVDGEVKFFSAEKGFGFVVPDLGGKDVFVGRNALQRSGIQNLEPGQRVRLATRMGKKGPMAEQISLI